MLKPKVIVIAGPTASGKTALSIELAKKINGEIISADSRLVYKGFDVACAKPTVDERQNVPHYMIDIITPDKEYSAGLYAKEAKKWIYNIANKGKIPIVVGGTGLYFRLLLENYIPPEIEPNYELRGALNKYHVDDLFNMLLELDKEGASTLESKQDKKKLIRALEIVKIGGKPLSEIRGINKTEEFDIDWIGLNYPREELYDRINKRVDIMLELGIVEETEKLLKTYGRIPNLTDTIGYREILSYIDGQATLEEATEKLKQNSRKYAKRQLTWFRKNNQIKWNIYPEPIKKKK